MNFLHSFYLLCLAYSVFQSLILHTLFPFSCYARIPSTVSVIYITSRSTLSFGVWPLIQSFYRSIQWTSSWKHKTPSLVHQNLWPLRTLMVIWNPAWSTPSLLHHLYYRLGPSWKPEDVLHCQLSMTTVMIQFLLCSLLPFYFSRPWTKV
jgi:hypothetical protein